MNPQQRTVAIVQSSYIPWKGYFDLIASSDVFVLFDDVQFTKRDWRSRNQIKTSTGLMWLSIPVQVKGKYLQKIHDVEVADSSWAKTHWNSIRHAYGKAKEFSAYEARFSQAYADAADLAKLSDINGLFIKLICDCLQITTELRKSEEFNLYEGKTERLAGICEQTGASAYLSGPAAADYIEQEHFDRRNIDLIYFDYSGYPEYAQLYPPFVHNVSVLDLLFNVGMESKKYLKCNQRDSVCQIL